MHFPMKIQPIDLNRETIRNDAGKPVSKSRLKRLFDRQFPSVLKTSSADKQITSELPCSKDGESEFESSSVYLDKLVQNFIEDGNEKPSGTKYSRNRCNCFNSNSNSSDDDEVEVFEAFDYDSEMLKGLIACASVIEKNLLTDVTKIVENNKACKHKADLRQIVTDGLSSLNYDVSICKSQWDKSPSYPAGDYEFIDAIVEGENLVIDIDFRSEFEIARPTRIYKMILQTLPYIFIGNSERVRHIVEVVSEATKRSMRKRGMYVPPWRKVEYMRAKWLSSHTRIERRSDDVPAEEGPSTPSDLELIFEEQSRPSMSMSTWQLPEVRPKRCEKGVKLVTGLASLLKEKQ